MGRLNATLTLEDFDDNTLWLSKIRNNSVIAFDDTDVANISLGIPVELMPYANLGLDALTSSVSTPSSAC
ncbi:MAG: hypothetical protein R3D70_12720 [Rhizobiaceae bacterium]